jgi:hypothetical protein
MPDSNPKTGVAKKTYTLFVTTEVFQTGFFWFISTVGSSVILSQTNRMNENAAFMSSMVVLFVSSAFWEVVTGWYADNFRRRTSLAAGFGCCAAGFVALIVGAAKQDLSIWLTGIGVWSLGTALSSGAQQAWVVDRCRYLENDDEYDDFEATFRMSASYSLIARSLGVAIGFGGFWVFGIQSLEHVQSNDSVFAIGALTSPFVLLCMAFSFYCSRLNEEYWTQPTRDEDEPVLTFIWRAALGVVCPPYCWFTLALAGLLGLNYIPSATAWRFAKNATGADGIPLVFIVILFAELVGGTLSFVLPKLVDKLANMLARLAIVAAVYVVPLTAMYCVPVIGLDGNDKQLERLGLFTTMGLAALLYRSAFAGMFGSLIASGQRAIKEEKRRALMLSLSSAAALICTSIPFLWGYKYSETLTLNGNIAWLWKHATPPFLIMLIVGSLLLLRHPSNHSDA